MNKESNRLSLHFLCVGVDPNFLAYLLTSADKMHVSLDSCRTYQEALEKIKNFAYDVYIIDFTSSEVEGLVLLQTIRERGIKRTLIALTVDLDKEKKITDQFKGTQLVDFILQKPIFPQKIDRFLQAITHFYAAPVVDPSAVTLQSLKQEYDKSIFNKLETLSDLIKKVKQEGTSQALVELKAAVHKLGGSAGTYGYLPVSELCKELVIEIDRKIGSHESLNQVELKSLDDFYFKVKNCFQTSFSSEPQDVMIPSGNKRPLVYVIDEDKNFTDLLKRVKEQFALEVETENNPRRARDYLNKQDFNPDMIVMAQNLQNSQVNPLDLIDEFKLKKNQKKTLFALLLDEDKLEMRVKAMEKGIDYIFRKPISAFVFLKAIKDALQVKNLSHIKVLILDDDEDLCRFVVAILMEIGITVKAINRSEELFQALDEFKPTMLLLDLILPEYDGMDLLRTLRQDVTYRDLLIVIITGNEESATRLNAYSARADDILYKPLDRNILQKRILNLVDRRNAVSESGSQDASGYLGLPSHKNLISGIHALLADGKSYEKFLALFEIKHLKNWTLQNGENKAKDLLISISNGLQGIAEDNIRCFVYNSSVFAILLNDISLSNAEAKIYNFLSMFMQNQTLPDFSFNASLVPVTKNIGNAQQILLKGEEALQKANEGNAKINLLNMVEDVQNSHKKEIVVVDADHDLLKILKQAFEAHGLVVKTFNEGGDALDTLCRQGKNDLPSLMIVERKLPDMDGMDLYQKLKSYFHQDIPFYVLTVFSSDKDISDGIRKGIREYIIKPFNISILVHKALKEISKNS